MKNVKRLNTLYDLPKDWQIPYNEVVDEGAYYLHVLELVCGSAEGRSYIEFHVELTDADGDISTYCSFCYYVGTAAFAELTKHFWSEGVRDYSSLRGYEELVYLKHGSKLAYIAARLPLHFESRVGDNR